MVQFDVNMKLSLSNSLCTDVPPPSEKISFIVLGPCSSSGIGLEGRSMVGTRAYEGREKVYRGQRERSRSFSDEKSIANQNSPH